MTDLSPGNQTQLNDDLYRALSGFYDVAFFDDYISIDSHYYFLKVTTDNIGVIVNMYQLITNGVSRAVTHNDVLHESAVIIRKLEFEPISMNDLLMKIYVDSVSRSSGYSLKYRNDIIAKNILKIYSTKTDKNNGIF